MMLFSGCMLKVCLFLWLTWLGFKKSNIRQRIYQLSTPQPPTYKITDYRGDTVLEKFGLVEFIFISV
jgi:hypothetical protein